MAYLLQSSSASGSSLIRPVFQHRAISPELENRAKAEARLRLVASCAKRDPIKLADSQRPIDFAAMPVKFQPLSMLGPNLADLSWTGKPLATLRPSGILTSATSQNIEELL